MKNLKLAAAVMAAASALASNANAAGFQLTEQSALALGRAYAGVGVDGTDISGVYYNPATMVLHKGTTVQGGGVLVGLNLDYADRDPANDQNGRGAEQFVPHGFVSHQINDRTWVGLAITVPFGMATDYSENWAHKDHGTNAEIMVIDFNPNFAWKLNEKFSVGAGISLQYADATLGIGADTPLNDSIRGELDVDTWAWGWNVGMMWAPVENLRFGLSYRSEVRHTAEGDLKVSSAGANDKTKPLAAMNGKYDGSVEMSAPAWAMATAAWDVNDMLSLYATFRWTDWSSFKELNIESQGLNSKLTAIGQGIIGSGMEGAEDMVKLMNTVATGMSNIQNNWKDTYMGALGADLRVNDFWTLRGGVAYETSPIKQPETRTAIIPDANRWWFAVGSTFNWTKQFQTDVAFAHLHGVGERNLYDKQSGEKIGRFRRLDAFLIGVQAQYKF